MCRLYCYYGPLISVSDILYKPCNNIIKQCFKYDKYLNIDGFGCSIYNIDNINPYIYKTINRPWRDINIKHISNYFNTNLLFAHIRATNPNATGITIHQKNCHPYNYKNISFQHNGDIHNWENIKNQCLQYINKKYTIQGNTDTELLFYMILTDIEKNSNINNIKSSIVIHSIKKILKIINKLQGDINKLSTYNIMITNGIFIIGTRYSNKNKKSPTLFILSDNKTIQVSTKPTNNNENWKPLFDNSVFIIENNNIIIKKFM